MMNDEWMCLVRNQRMANQSDSFSDASIGLLAGFHQHPSIVSKTLKFCHLFILNSVLNRVQKLKRLMFEVIERTNWCHFFTSIVVVVRTTFISASKRDSIFGYLKVNYHQTFYSSFHYKWIEWEYAHALWLNCLQAFK